MTDFDFTLAISGVSGLTDAQADALFAAGCDDGTPGVRGGSVTLNFTRAAASRADAVASAIRDAKAAGFDAAEID